MMPLCSDECKKAFPQGLSAGRPAIAAITARDRGLNGMWEDVEKKKKHPRDVFFFPAPLSLPR